MSIALSRVPRLPGTRFSTLVLATGALALARGGIVSAADNIIPLDEYVVSATRTPQDARSLPFSVELIDLNRLADRQVTDLRTALSTVPGVNVSNTGAAGGSSALFIRGASSHQVSLMIDGVRMNDRSASYVTFLGGADLAGIDRFEVLRGPQSTLYGSSAMGGVVMLETAAGASDDSGGVVSGSAGSFGTRSGSIFVHGGSSRTGYSASLSGFETDNDRPGNGFEMLGASARLDGRPSDALLVGGTVRWQRSDFAEPGSRLFPYAGSIDFENLLVTSYGEWAADSFRSRVTAALHRRDYTFSDDFSATVVENTRQIVDWQNTWAASTGLEVVAGLNYESSRMDVNGGRSDDDLFAGYLSATWRAREDVVLNAGMRHDEFDSAGGATTGRAGVAWLLDERRTKLRASVGTGFTAPGADDRYGIPIWGQVGNPDIRPEKSRGWDAGIDRDFADGRVTLAATYFHNRYRDLFEYETIDFTTFEGMIVNRSRATTKGVELALRVRPSSTIGATLAYTRLDATNDDDGSRLIRRPRHTLALDGHLQATSAWLIGAGVQAVADRLDSTATGAAEIEDYTTVRFYTSYALRPELQLSLRIENALDEAYEEVFGYAALPRAVYGSVEWRF